MVDESPAWFATDGRVSPKSAWIDYQFEVDCRRQVTKSILNREEVLTDTSPRTSMTRRANKEGLANAIDNDDFCSSRCCRAFAPTLERLPVAANVWSRRHDVAAGRHRAERRTIGR
jgi:hypothetical protein